MLNQILVAKNQNYVVLWDVDKLTFLMNCIDITKGIYGTHAVVDQNRRKKKNGKWNFCVKSWNGIDMDVIW